jgi:ubiquinol-cytochrome c reductase cytochrome b subunit
MKYDENWKWGTDRFFPHEMSIMMRNAMILMIVLFAIVVFFPDFLIPRETPADPLNTPEHIKPEWYFVAAYQGLKAMGKIFPANIFGSLGEITGIGIQVLVLTAMMTIPFWDRKKPRSVWKKPILFALSVIGILVFISFTIWGMSL